MKYLFVAIATLFLSYTVDIGVVNAQQPICVERTKLVERLLKKFGEERIAVATSKGNLIEFFVNKRTHSWTMIGTKPSQSDNRISCLLGSGKDFYYKSLKGQEKGEKS